MNDRQKETQRLRDGGTKGRRNSENQDLWNRRRDDKEIIKMQKN